MLNGHSGVSVANLFLPWDVLDPIGVELVGDVLNDHCFELLPMARRPALRWVCSDIPLNKRGLMWLRQWSRKSLFFAALSCAIRPTSAITWVFLYSALLWRILHDPRAVWRVLFQATCIGFVFKSLQTRTLVLTGCQYSSSDAKEPFAVERLKRNQGQSQ
jgi:hypothetical protein